MASKSIKQIYIICGPTASGKSSIALKLAEDINGCIINADSMQVYSSIEILTASPSKTDKKEIPHLLYNFIPPEAQYSVANFIEDASKALNTALENNQIPIFTGGTGMYINSLLNGISEIPEIPKFVREDTEEIIKEKNLEFLFKELEILDPAVAATLNKNDSQRIIRAYSVVKFTGNSILSYRNADKKSLLQNFDIKILYINPDREFLYKTCNERFISLVQNGAIEEVKDFTSKYGDIKTGAAKALGFQELKSYINKEISKEDAISLAQIKTRQYAKRQQTWFNNQLKHPHDIIISQKDINLSAKNMK